MCAMCDVRLSSADTCPSYAGSIVLSHTRRIELSAQEYLFLHRTEEKKVSKTEEVPKERRTKLDKLFNKKNMDVLSSSWSKMRADDDEDGSDAGEFFSVAQR